MTSPSAFDGPGYGLRGAVKSFSVLQSSGASIVGGRSRHLVGDGAVCSAMGIEKEVSMN